MTENTVSWYERTELSKRRQHIPPQQLLCRLGLHAWRTAHDTGATRYEQCARCCKRSVTSYSGGYQPIDRVWMSYGEWDTGGIPPQIPPQTPTEPGLAVGEGGGTGVPRPASADSPELVPELRGSLPRSSLRIPMPVRRTRP